MRFFDLHCDTATETLRKETSLYNDSWHISLDYLPEAGIKSYVQCFAVFVPNEFDADGAADLLRRTAAHLRSAEREGVFRVHWEGLPAEDACIPGGCDGILTVESARMLEKPQYIDLLAEHNVRIASLCWNGDNPLAGGVRSSGRLTAAGKRAVGLLEERGIVLDVSHLNDESFWDVAALARRPFIATHSDARALCRHPRNLTDDQFKAIRDGGGIVGLNFCNEFLAGGGSDPSLDDICRHAEHFLSLDGEKTVAFGCDMDGADIPSAVGDLRGIQKLFAVMRERFGAELCDDLFFGNAHRFLHRQERP